MFMFSNYRDISISIFIQNSKIFLLWANSHALKLLTIPNRPITRTSAPSLFRPCIRQINVIPPPTTASVLLLVLTNLVTSTVFTFA